MPSSLKGRNGRRGHKPVPITPDHARKLRAAVGNRPPTAPLLVRADGERWRRYSHLKAFAEAARRAGVDCTLYALRRSSLVGSISANLPLRIVAALPDTSVGMLEKVYNAHIADFSDTVARKVLLDLAPSTSDNIIPLPGRRS
jgi:hypothetical protein